MTLSHRKLKLIHEPITSTVRHSPSQLSVTVHSCRSQNHVIEIQIYIFIFAPLSITFHIVYDEYILNKFVSCAGGPKGSAANR